MITFGLRPEASWDEDPDRGGGWRVSNDDTARNAVHLIDARLEDRRLQAALGYELRIAFDSVASEPIPERFIVLLKALAEKEGNK
jgi:hypothetical protein